MSDGEALHIELDEDAAELLSQLKGQYASRLVSRAVDALGGGSCTITAADIRRIADEKFDESLNDTAAEPIGRAASGLTSGRFSIIRMLLILGLAVLIGSGVALGALLISSVVKSDVSRILLVIAMLGASAIVIGAVGLVVARYNDRDDDTSKLGPRGFTGRAQASYPQKDSQGVGRIPFTFRVGVTGHRALDHPRQLRAAVTEAFNRLCDEIVPEPAQAWLVPVVVSALAEGADRLVADAILDMPGARLEAVLPLPPEDYLSDFKTESKAEFTRLLGKAAETWQAPPSSSREEAYERAGHYVVDRCDALIALWDGEPPRGRGGTAAIVAYARSEHVPLARVSTKGEVGTVVYEPGPERASVVQDAVHKLLRYNADNIPAKSYDVGISEQRRELVLDEPSGTDSFGRLRQRVGEWLIPYFVRADTLALRLQRRFRRLTTGMFVMAAAAVAIVALQTNFFASLNWLVALEVILLLCLVSLPLLNRRWQLHDKWISYRFLAERLRSAYYLTLAGTGDRQARAGRLDYFSDSSETWIERALSEVLAHRPAGDLTSSDLTALKEYLGSNWIGQQICYHRNASKNLGSRDTWLIRVTTILFAITLVAAFVHMLGWGEHGSHRSHLAVLLIVLSISVPAIGAAIHGIGTLREYRRNSQRYVRMVKLLTKLQQQMLNADSLERVRALAAETEQIMREENSDWFGVMRFHDMELIT